MVVRCHFDLYSSRKIILDPHGDEFPGIESARKMSRSILLDFASHHFDDGEEFAIVCKMTTRDPKRYMLTHLVMIDEVVNDSKVISGQYPVQDWVEGRKRIFSDLTDGSEFTYRVSADWSRLRELDGGRMSAANGAERAWFMEFIPRDEHPRINAEIDMAIRFRAPFNVEHRTIRADDSLGWTRSRALPVVDEHGRITDWIGVAKDVTAHH